jgi:hypothetical protein
MAVRRGARGHGNRVGRGRRARYTHRYAMPTDRTPGRPTDSGGCSLGPRPAAATMEPRARRRGHHDGVHDPHPDPWARRMQRARPASDGAPSRAGGGAARDVGPSCLDVDDSRAAAATTILRTGSGVSSGSGWTGPVIAYRLPTASGHVERLPSRYRLVTCAVKHPITGPPRPRGVPADRQQGRRLDRPPIAGAGDDRGRARDRTGEHPPGHGSTRRSRASCTAARRASPCPTTDAK